MAVLLFRSYFTGIPSSLNHRHGFVEDSETVAPAPAEPPRLHCYACSSSCLRDFPSSVFHAVSPLALPP